MEYPHTTIKSLSTIVICYYINDYQNNFADKKKDR